MDASDKSIKVPNLVSRLADLTYLIFRSTILAQSVDYRAPSKSTTLEFSLCLPRSYSFSKKNSTTTSITGNASPLTSPPPQIVAEFSSLRSAICQTTLF